MSHDIAGEKKTNVRRHKQSLNKDIVYCPPSFLLSVYMIQWPNSRTRQKDDRGLHHAARGCNGHPGAITFAVDNVHFLVTPMTQPLDVLRGPGIVRSASLGAITVPLKRRHSFVLRSRTKVSFNSICVFPWVPAKT